MASHGLTVTLIAAIGENHELGKDGGLPWHLPDDLKRFKAVTRGHAIVMGRKTYATLLKALPERHSIVVSRTMDPSEAAEGVDVVRSLDEAFSVAASGPRSGMGRVYVVGGGEIYRQALSVADKLDLTRVQGRFGADAHFPQFEGADWRLEWSENHPPDERHSHGFTFELWCRAASTE